LKMKVLDYTLNAVLINLDNPMIITNGYSNIINSNTNNVLKLVFLTEKHKP
jgi:hypothetical protein